MKLYTRFGDSGETALFDGTRVSKDHLRVAAYGDVDELNAVLGWCRTAGGPEWLSERLERLQNELFILGSELATPPDSLRSGNVPRMTAEHYARLERWIDEATDAAPPIRNFILPGGNESAARLHIARTCCRRAERSVVALSHQEPVRGEVIIYLNRVSDLLFAWARQVNHLAGVGDVLWIAPETGPADHG